MLKKTTHTAFAAALCLALSACTGGATNGRLDYREAKPLPGLEVPPDLTAPTATGLEDIPQLDATRVEQVLPKATGMRVQRDGAERWLLIDTPAEKLWPKLREFWPTLGLELVMDEPALGLMVTDWAENRADTPTGFFSGMVKKVFPKAYSADTRDKYRLRLERREDGKVELFLAHYGLQEVVAVQSDIVTETVWQVRPSDRELANEVMNRLVLFLGGSETTAREVLATPQEPAPSRARMAGEQLIMNEGFARTWRLTGIALDRLGLVVEDRNRSDGIYYVSKIDLVVEAQEGRGLLGGLFASEEKESTEVLERQILLRGDEQTTRITVRDSAGNPDHSATAKLILQRLQEELK